ncbi:MAG: ParB N-terminal domain-containing protein [Roseiarcus sp.]
MRVQVRKIADSIETFGFNAPILIDKRSRIVAGHGRYEAAIAPRSEAGPRPQARAPGRDPGASLYARGQPARRPVVLGRRRPSAAPSGTLRAGAGLRPRGDRIQSS